MLVPLPEPDARRTVFFRVVFPRVALRGEVLRRGVPRTPTLRVAVPRRGAISGSPPVGGHVRRAPESIKPGRRAWAARAVRPLLTRLVSDRDDSDLTRRSGARTVAGRLSASPAWNDWKSARGRGRSRGRGGSRRSANTSSPRARSNTRNRLSARNSIQQDPPPARSPARCAPPPALSDNDGPSTVSEEPPMSVEERLPARSEVIPRDRRGSDRAFLVEELRRLASPSSSGRTVPLSSSPNRRAFSKAIRERSESAEFTRIDC